MLHLRTRHQLGQSIIETVVGIIFMIPIVLFLFDVAVLVLGNTANDNLAKQSARAAASAVNSSATPPKGDIGVASTAARNIVTNFATSGFIDKVECAFIWYNDPNANTSQDLDTGPLGQAPSQARSTDPGAGNLAVVTGMEVRAPVPFPFFDTHRTFWARAVEPIVAIPPQ